MGCLLDVDPHARAYSITEIISLGAPWSPQHRSELVLRVGMRRTTPWRSHMASRAHALSTCLQACAQANLWPDGLGVFCMVLRALLAEICQKRLSGPFCK